MYYVLVMVNGGDSVTFFHGEKSNGADLNR